MASEQTFYSDEEGVRITGTRAIFRNTTYTMANIASIRTNRIPPKRAGALWIILIGLALSIIGISSYISTITIIGVIVLLLGILWFWKAPSEYHIMITSASGEVSAIKSKDKDYINRIAQAMNEAIINRG
ncbi:DUF6232 family protein [Chloroflexota bacterium]